MPLHTPSVPASPILPSAASLLTGSTQSYLVWGWRAATERRWWSSRWRCTPTVKCCRECWTAPMSMAQTCCCCNIKRHTFGPSWEEVHTQNDGAVLFQNTPKYIYTHTVSRPFDTAVARKRSHAEQTSLVYDAFCEQRQRDCRFNAWSQFDWMDGCW